MTQPIRCPYCQGELVASTSATVTLTPIKLEPAPVTPQHVRARRCLSMYTPQNFTAPRQCRLPEGHEGLHVNGDRSWYDSNAGAFWLEAYQS